MKRLFLLIWFLPLCVSGFGADHTPPPPREAERANIPQEQNSREAGDRMVLTINDVEYAFRWCPAGWFMQGSPTDEPGRQQWEEAQRGVVLTRGFWMLETPVTQAMWMSVMGNNPSIFRGLNLPVENVSWDNSQQFIAKLNELIAGTPAIPGAPAGFRFSLPTEAQWEYACRAGTTTAFSFGDTLTREQANFRDSGIRQTSEVGRFPANAWGLRDMHGNVLEWCQDWFDYPSGAVTAPVIDPTGPSSGSDHRVARGGCWDYVAGNCRSASRYGTDPSFRSNFVGLRLSLVFAESR